MKQIYIRVILILLLSPVQHAFSQCTCSDGSMPDSVAYDQYYDSIIATNTSMVFPKFSDTIGLLSCLKLSDTVTTVVNYNLENINLDTEDYIFETYRRSQFTGPDGFFSSVVSPPKDYGPYHLGNNENVDIGPDTVFNQNAHTEYFGGSSSYYGSGNVTLNYLTTSTFTILTGSDNAIITLKAYTRLKARLVYYWCPFSVLETDLSGFAVAVKNNNVAINWELNNLHPTGTYEIEMSTDGKNFTDLGGGISEVSGNVTSSQFVYVPDKNYTGSMYFRIKHTDVSGKVSYSEIRSVYIDNSQKSKLSVYPNPAVSGVNIQFVNSNANDYRVELINSYGQLLFQKNYNLSKAASINIDWPNKPAPGTYFLKITDVDHHSEQVKKLKIL